MSAADVYDQQRPDARPRSKSHMSFKSDRSHKSQGSIDKKQKYTETQQEKRKSAFTKTGKANPNAAINEAQPIALALEAPTIAPLRGIEHRDAYGNPINDPDLSNPTRPRWERPLDTIKSFEAAIDSEYKRRTLMVRADTAPDAGSDFQSRRSSYFGGYNNESSRPPQSGGYYSSRNVASRDRDAMAESGYGGPPPPFPSRNRYGQRVQQPEPVAPRHNNYHGQPVYPNHGYQQSRDTVHTGGSGSGSEALGNSTDPSSDNSSVERHTPVMRPEAGEQYGFTGFGNAPILEENPYPSQYPQLNRRPEEGQYPPPPPQHRVGPAAHPQPPVPSKQPYSAGYNARDGGQQQQQQQQQQYGVANGNALNRPKTLTKTDSNDKADKRKSWFKRRFSKD